MELEYEGEQLGAHRIARELIKRAAGEIFEGYFVGIDFTRAVQWFDEGNKLLVRTCLAFMPCLPCGEPFGERHSHHASGFLDEEGGEPEMVDMAMRKHKVL